jgi:hypothetical protein
VPSNGVTLETLVQGREKIQEGIDATWTFIATLRLRRTVMGAMRAKSADLYQFLRHECDPWDSSPLGKCLTCERMCWVLMDGRPVGCGRSA